MSASEGEGAAECAKCGKDQAIAAVLATSLISAVAEPLASSTERKVIVYILQGRGAASAAAIQCCLIQYTVARR